MEILLWLLRLQYMHKSDFDALCNHQTDAVRYEYQVFVIRKISTLPLFSGISYFEDLASLVYFFGNVAR